MDIKKIITGLEKSLAELKSYEEELSCKTKPKSEYINDDYSYTEIKAIADSGKIEEHFFVGDKIKVGRGEGKSIIFDVVKTSPHGMCLMTHDLVAQMPFDAPEPKNPDNNIAEYGSNDYLNSSVRQWINSADYSGDWWELKTEYDTPIGSKDFLDGFVYGMDTGFLDILECDENGDKFFLLSEDEITNWLPNAEDRIKSYASGEKDWYWTRTPHSGYSCDVRNVDTSGTLNYYGAYIAYGVAPACVIGRIW